MNTIKLVLRLAPGTAIAIASSVVVGTNVREGRINGALFAATIAWGLGILWVGRVLDVRDGGAR